MGIVFLLPLMWKQILEPEKKKTSRAIFGVFGALVVIVMLILGAIPHLVSYVNILYGINSLVWIFVGMCCESYLVV